MAGGRGRAPGATGHVTRVEIYRPFSEVIERSRAALKARIPGKHPSLTKEQYVKWCNESGIHLDTIGPVCRAADDLGWVLMFRGLRAMAKEHASSFDTLPKPMEIKIKCDDDSGLVCCSEAGLKAAIDKGEVTRTYADSQKLKVIKKAVYCKNGQMKEKEVLVNERGQGFYSDMDLFAVIDIKNGDRIMMGSGREEHEPVAQIYRAQLDKLINALTGLGPEFNLIQHGADYDWADRKGGMKDEAIAIFIPFGAMLIIQTIREAEEFMLEVQRQARAYAT